MLVIKKLQVPIDFHSISFPTMEVNRDWGPKKIGLVFQKIFFCVQYKKETYIGLERHEGEITITDISFLGELFL